MRRITRVSEFPGTFRFRGRSVDGSIVFEVAIAVSCYQDSMVEWLEHLLDLTDPPRLALVRADAATDRPDKRARQATPAADHVRRVAALRRDR